MTLDSVAARTPDGRQLFHNLSLTFGAERTGVVGRNGVGKTTLLGLIAGLTEPTSGSVVRCGRTGWLEQVDAPLPGQTVADLLDVAEPLAVQARILAGHGTEADLAEADWTLEERLARILTSVGLPDLSLDRLADSLSGGERTRARIARLLLSEPDLIILDEPTNHLDAEGRGAIHQLLETWRGGAVVVSHDRNLLQQMDRIVEITSLGTAVYGGNYDLFSARKAEELANTARALSQAEQAQAQAARDRQKSLERQARRDRAGKATARKGSEPRILLGARAAQAEATGARLQGQAQRQVEQAGQQLDAARERIERLQPMRFTLPPTGLATGRTVLQLSGVRWTTPEGRRVLDGIDLTLTGPERLAVVGANGSGKSTLLKLMAGQLAPSEGTITRPVPTARLDQDTAQLLPDETLRDAWLRLHPGGTVNDAQAALARFLFRNAAAERTVGTLSGGERLRAALAVTMTGKDVPQLLILDEPTNHLDLDAMTALEEALSAYDGALVVASHDTAFLTRLNLDRELRL